MLVSSGSRFLPARLVTGKKCLARRHQYGMTSHGPSPAAHGCSQGPPLGVRAWRRCRLLDAGFPADLAEAVAADPRFDLHALLELVDRGCPPPLAVHIVAPLPRCEAP